MRRLLRPTSLFLLLGLVVVAAVAWVYRTTELPSRPAPLPVAEEDHEIAWLNAATATSNWQRFVQAVTAISKSEPGPETFPRRSTAVPEISVPLPGQKGKLRIRWYKLTSEWDTRYWADALMNRSPPPLAIIGGNTTDSATEQAREIRRAAASLGEKQRPLLLLTTATGDRIPSETAPADPDGIPLIDVYPGRTFRFCFSNRQMGQTVTRFIWGQDELRPDAFPIYTVEWKDDPYSADLIRGFLSAIEPIQGHGLAAAAAGDWGIGAGFAAGGGFPLGGLTVQNHQPPDALFPQPTYIPWSVGSFDRPNHYEATAALQILDDSNRHPRQRRALLVLSGQSGPSRRLVRAMCRLSPIRTRRFVLASGDTISFSTIVRDRNVSWPIQDLPCSLVLFCHNNPVGNIAGEQPRGDTSGTEDLLLYQDIVEALMQASTYTGKLCATADELREGLRQLRVTAGRVKLSGDGPHLFDEQGNRQSGTGEHVVWLKPSFVGERVLPEARIVVFAWHPQRGAWEQRGEPLRVLYTGGRPE